MSEKKCITLNTAKVVHPNIEKPCGKLGFCPYGSVIVKDMPLNPNKPTACTEANGAIVSYSNDCPVHYLPDFVKNKAVKSSGEFGKFTDWFMGKKK